MGWWCFSGQCWADIQRMRQEYPLVQRLRRHTDRWEPDNAKLKVSLQANPYDVKMMRDARNILYGQPLFVGMVTLILLRTNRLRNQSLRNHIYKRANGYAVEYGASVTTVAFTYSMLNRCEYINQRINPEFIRRGRNLPLRPGTSYFTDSICSLTLAAMRDLREDQTVDQSLLKDAQLSFLQEIIEEERRCKLRFAFQKKLQREDGISNDNLLFPVHIPYPGVPDDGPQKASPTASVAESK